MAKFNVEQNNRCQLTSENIKIQVPSKTVFFLMLTYKVHQMVLCMLSKLKDM